MTDSFDKFCLVVLHRDQPSFSTKRAFEHISSNPALVAGFSNSFCKLCVDTCHRLFVSSFGAFCRYSHFSIMKMCGIRKSRKGLERNQILTRPTQSSWVFSFKIAVVTKQRVWQSGTWNINRKERETHVPKGVVPALITLEKTELYELEREREQKLQFEQKLFRLSRSRDPAKLAVRNTAKGKLFWSL